PGVFTGRGGPAGADHGETSRPSSSPPSNGSIGSTTEGSWNPSAIYRRPKPSNATTPCWNNRPWRHNLNQTASGKPGAVQFQLDRRALPSLTPIGDILQRRIASCSSFAAKTRDL